MVKLVLLRILESYFRHRWLYWLPMVIMLALAGASVFLAKPEFIASGVLYVDKESLLSTLVSIQETTFSWDTPANDTSTEISELLQTDSFVRAVIKATDLEDVMDEGTTAVSETIDNVREAAWTDAIGNNQVLVAAAGTDPDLSYQLVNSVIENYVQWKINANRAEGSAANEFFDDLIVQYENELAVARQEYENFLVTYPSPVRGDRPDIETLELERIQADLELASSRYASALENKENIQLSLSQVESEVRQTYFVIDAPVIPEEPSTSLKQIAVQVVIFAAVGALLMGAAIVGNAIIDRSLLFPVDIYHATYLPVLAAVPDIGNQQMGIPQANKDKTFGENKLDRSTNQEKSQTKGRSLGTANDGPDELNSTSENPIQMTKQEEIEYE